MLSVNPTKISNISTNSRITSEELTLKTLLKALDKKLSGLSLTSDEAHNRTTVFIDLAKYLLSSSIALHNDGYSKEINQLKQIINTNSLFFQPLDKLSFFALVYLFNFINPIDLFKANGMLDFATLKTEIENLTCEFNLDKLPTEYVTEVKIQARHMRFTLNSKAKDSYIHHIDNKVINIRYFQLQKYNINKDREEQKFYRYSVNYPGTVIYDSIRGDLQVNFNEKIKVVRKEIVCRHLAFEYLRFAHEKYYKKGLAKEPIPLKTLSFNAYLQESAYAYHGAFESEELIRKNENLHKFIFDLENIRFKADKYYFVSLKSFNQCLIKICEGMKANDIKCATFLSPGHLMAIIIKYKEDHRIKIEIFDPNVTHVPEIIETDDLTKINIFRSRIVFYFMKNPRESNNPVVLFSIYNHPSTTDWATKEITNYQDWNLEFVDKDSNPLPSYLFLGHQPAIKDKVKEILKNNLFSLDKKIQLLQAKDGLGNMALYLLLQLNCVKVVKCFIKIILASTELTAKAKCDILLIKGNKEIEGNRVETVGIDVKGDHRYNLAIDKYIYLISQDKNLALEDKQLLLPGHGTIKIDCDICSIS